MLGYRALFLALASALGACIGEAPPRAATDARAFASSAAASTATPFPVSALKSGDYELRVSAPNTRRSALRIAVNTELGPPK